MAVVTDEHGKVDFLEDLAHSEASLDDELTVDLGDDKPTDPVAPPAFRPTYLDLLSDYSSCDRILVDGDAVLMQLFSDGKIGETTNEPSFVYERDCGQVLHAVFHFEGMLARMRDRAARFDVVFFAYNRALFSGHPALLLIRDLIVRHLRNSEGLLQSHELPDQDLDARDLRPTLITQFNHWMDPAFENHIRRLNPTFVLLYDGLVDTNFKKSNMALQVMFFLARGYHVVYSSRISFVGNHMFTFCVRAESWIQRNAQAFIKTFSKMCGEESFNDSVRGFVMDEYKKRLAAVSDAKWPVPAGALSIRASLGAAACARAKSASGLSDDVYWALAQLFVGHLVLMEYIPLELRAQRGAILPGEQAERFLACVCGELAGMVAMEADVPANNEALGKAVCDLVDARLFYSLLAACVEGEGSFASADAFFAGVQGGPQCAVDAWKLAGSAAPPMFPVSLPDAELMAWRASYRGARFRRNIRDEDDSEEDLLLDADDRLHYESDNESSISEDEPLLPICTRAFEALGVGITEEDAERDSLGLPVRPEDDVRVYEINALPDYKDVYACYAGKTFEEEDLENDPEDDEVQVEKTPAEELAERRKVAKSSVNFKKYCEAEKDKSFKGKPSAWVFIIGDDAHAQGRREKRDEKLLSIFLRRNDRKKEKFKQKTANYMQRYSESLEGKQKYRTTIPGCGTLDERRAKKELAKFDLHTADPGAGEHALGTADRPSNGPSPYLCQELPDLPFKVPTKEPRVRLIVARTEAAAAAEEEEAEAAEEAPQQKKGKGKPNTQAQKDALKAQRKAEKEAAKAAKKAAKKGKKQPTGKEKGKEKGKGKGKDKKKAGGKQTVEEIRQENSAKMALEKKNSALKACAMQIQNASVNYTEAVRQMRAFADGIKPEDAISRWAWVKAKVFELKMQRKRIKEAVSEGKPTDRLVANTLRTVYDVRERISLTPPPAELELGTLELEDREREELDGAVTDCLVVDGVRPEQRFQLRHMGHLLRRTTEGVPDARTKFIPDAWQRRLLDAVDARESCVVCAPTSSGKTFVSYYCMEQVLRESDDGVVIYVAPTKSLANQVAAEVFGRLDKAYPSVTGRSTYSIFTRDFKENDPLNCQVLITVPAMLEILLLSPTQQSADWRRRLRYVIFDEVHNIGVKDESSTWEHLLLLIRCPFLALSATVGNPNEFASWLHRNQALQYHQEVKCLAKSKDTLERCYTTLLVAHHERWSDLQKYIWLPKFDPGRYEPSRWSWEEQLEMWGGNDLEYSKHPRDDRPPRGEFFAVHPISTVSVRGIAAGGFPAALSFVPRDSVVLAEAMLQATEDLGDTSARAEVEKVLPENFFPSGTGVSRKQAKEYEMALKNLFTQWAKHPDKVKVAETVREILDQQMSTAVDAATAALPGRLTLTNDEYVRTHFVPFLQSMEDNDMLPALVFSFRREFCRRLVEITTLELEAAERKSRDYPGFAEQVKALEKKVKQLEKTATKPANKPGKKQEDGDENDERDNEDENAELTETRARLTAMTGVDPRFTFIQEGRVTETEVSELIHTNLKWWDPNHILLRGLRRGIGVHHAGMPKKYRHLVEILFRMQYLKVVVATSTLAQGIHMPCRTSVFCGDSHFLDSVNFHQMSGRAGRRGFDDLGHVVFFGLPRLKIETLMTADLPVLRGEFPISCGIVLRMIMMYEQARQNLEELEAEAAEKGMYQYKTLLNTYRDEERTVRNAIQCVLREPLFNLSKPGERAKHQLQHHLRFALEFLARARCISTNGEIVDLAGLAAHLYWTEPNNFLLVEMLKEGLFDDLCNAAEDTAETSVENEAAKKGVLTVLCYLFGTLPLHESLASAQAKAKDCPGLVALPPLTTIDVEGGSGQRISDFIQLYNARIIRHLCNYVRLYARQVDSGRLEREVPGVIEGTSATSSDLPFTGMRPCPGADVQELTDGICGVLATKRVHYRARSPFSSISGLGDRDFDSVVDLVENLRSDVYLDETAVPLVDVRAVVPRSDATSLLFNAYILDFYTHGQKQPLTRANGLREGDAWQKLKEFELSIGAIVSALNSMDSDIVNPNVKRVFVELRKEFCYKFERFNVVEA